MGLMSTLFSNVSSKLDNAIESIINIDLNNVNKKMMELSETVQTKTSKLVEQIKTMREKHIIEIPYDNTTSKFSFKIENRILDINVTNDDGSTQNETRISLPENVDINNIRQTYDSSRKVMIFKFGLKN